MKFDSFNVCASMFTEAELRFGAIHGLTVGGTVYTRPVLDPQNIPHKGYFITKKDGTFYAVPYEESVVNNYVFDCFSYIMGLMSPYKNIREFLFAVILGDIKVEANIAVDFVTMPLPDYMTELKMFTFTVNEYGKLVASLKEEYWHSRHIYYDAE